MISTVFVLSRTTPKTQYTGCSVHENNNGQAAFENPMYNTNAKAVEGKAVRFDPNLNTVCTMVWGWVVHTRAPLHSYLLGPRLVQGCEEEWVYQTSTTKGLLLFQFRKSLCRDCPAETKSQRWFPPLKKSSALIWQLKVEDCCREKNYSLWLYT